VASHGFDVFPFGSSVTLLSSHDGDVDACLARSPPRAHGTVGRHLPLPPSNNDDTQQLFKATVSRLSSMARKDCTIKDRAQIARCVPRLTPVS